MIRIKTAVVVVCILSLLFAGCKRTPQSDNSQTDINRSSGAASTTAPEKLTEKDSAEWDDAWDDRTGTLSSSGSSLSPNTSSSGTVSASSRVTSGAASESSTSLNTTSTTKTSEGTGSTHNDWTPNY